AKRLAAKRLFFDGGVRRRRSGSLFLQELLPENRHLAWGLDAQTDLAPVDIDHRDADVFADVDFLTQLAAQDKHVATLLRASPRFISKSSQDRCRPEAFVPVLESLWSASELCLTIAGAPATFAYFQPTLLLQGRAISVPPLKSAPS